MQNRFDEALDAKEAAIRKFDADISARLLAHYDHQLFDQNPEALASARAFVHMEGLMLREAIPFVWAPDITRAVMQAAESLPRDVALHESWLHADAGWWWFGNHTPLVGASLVGTDRGLPLERPIHALVYRYMKERHSISLELLSGAHDEPTPGPVAISGHEWKIGTTLTDFLAQIDSAATKSSFEKGARAAVNRLGLKDYRESDRDTWIKIWVANITMAALTFAAGSLWLSQRVLVEEPAQASRGARRRAEKIAGTSEVRVVRLRRTEHAAESEDAERAAGEGGRSYSCQWVVRGHWRNQYYATVKAHRPIWIDPYVKGPDEAPLKTSKTIFAVDR